MRTLGFHHYDRELGIRQKYFEYVRWSSAVTAHVDTLSRALFNDTMYAAAHIRVADAHWERSDCKHSINGVPVPSVSCGDGSHVINASSLAQEIW